MESRAAAGVLNALFELRGDIAYHFEGLRFGRRATPEANHVGRESTERVACASPARR